MTAAQDVDCSERLNPFFIRSIVQYLTDVDLTGVNRLNPFFIRSIVQFIHNDVEQGSEVLIPSSSGQSFNEGLRPGDGRFQVLIPSSSGQSFNDRARVGGGAVVS